MSLAFISSTRRRMAVRYRLPTPSATIRATFTSAIFRAKMGENALALRKSPLPFFVWKLTLTAHCFGRRKIIVSDYPDSFAALFLMSLPQKAFHGVMSEWQRRKTCLKVASKIQQRMYSTKHVTFAFHSQNNIYRLPMSHGQLVPNLQIPWIKP